LILESDIKEDFLYFIPTDDRTTSLEVLNIINHFIEENEINWDNSIGHCTDRAQSISERNAGLQALVRNNVRHTIWKNCMLQVQAPLSRNISEELQTIFRAVIRFDNYAEKSPLKSYVDSMDAEQTLALSCQNASQVI
jgi:hypothetical protein